MRKSCQRSRLARKLFVCGDTGGLKAESRDGRPVDQLGLNMPVVTDALRSSFATPKLAGIAYLKRSGDLAFLGPSREPIAVLAVQRQSLRQELGRTSEHSVSLHMISIQAGGEQKVLDPAERAALVRATLSATRTKDTDLTTLRQEIGGALEEFALTLKRPTSEEISLGIRHAIWLLRCWFSTKSASRCRRDDLQRTQSVEPA